MRQAGYDVLSFVQNPSAHPDTLGISNAFRISEKSHIYWLKSDWWLNRLKSFFLSDPIVKEWIFEMNPIAKKINSFRPANNKTIVPSNLIYDAFLKSISERDKGSDQPFFAWLQVFPPHDYYLPPEPFMGMFGDANRYVSDAEQELAELGAPYDPERQHDVDILRKRYDEFIVYSDNEFQKFITRLSNAADLSNTIIILTSDHGESFSNGWLAHRGPHLSEPLVHVPLIIKMPGDTPDRSTDILVDHTDLAPTILELAGLQVPEWIEGRSLAPVIQGGNLLNQPVFSMQFSNTPVTGNRSTDRGTIAVWEGDYKLVYYIEDNKKILYDLSSDPDEKLDLSNERPEIAGNMLKLILKRLNKHD
jgi:arylsulfatase A-like enzyme